MRLTELAYAGVLDLDPMDYNTWHIDKVGNLVFEPEISDSIDDPRVFIVWLDGSEGNNFESMSLIEARQTLQPPFKPINIKEIIFERIT